MGFDQNTMSYTDGDDDGEKVSVIEKAETPAEEPTDGNVPEVVAEEETPAVEGDKAPKKGLFGRNKN